MPEIKKLELDAPETKSADVVAENLNALWSLFPDAFREGKINFDVLKQLLGGAVDERDEKYGLNWFGKRKARQIALTPSTGTLLPNPKESLDWDTTRNLVIEGDNLEVLKLMQKSYSNKAKIIYIDPPYNTGGDFVYPDDYSESIKNYLEITGQSENNRKVSSNTETSGRYHTDWLNMMYPRIKLAKNLMREDGLMFVSCDDVESHHLRAVLDEIFGEENFIAQIAWKKSYGGGAKTKHVVTLQEHIYCFAKNKDAVGRLELPADPAARKYYKFRDSKYEIRGPYRLQPLATTSNDDRANLRYAIPYNGEDIWPEKQWQWEKKRALEALQNDDLSISKNNGEWSVNYKQYLRDEDGVERGAKPFSLLDGPYTQMGTSEIKNLLGDQKIFPFPKPTELIRKLVQYAHPETDFLTIDFFAGSGSTGHAIMAQNQADGGQRRYILVQLPEPIDPDNSDQKSAAQFCDSLGVPRNIAELTKERLRRAAKIYRKESPSFNEDVGFRVYKLASSNIHAWTPDVSDLDGTLLAHAEHIAHGRTEQDVLYELLLKLGLDLCVPIEKKQIAGKAVYAVGGGALIVCLADGLTKEVVESLAAGIVEWRKALAPAVDARVVFKDSGFADDVAKTNMAAILNQSGILDVRSL